MTLKPDTEPGSLGLKDVAYHLGLSVHTLRHDWKERVRKGHLPAALAHQKTPKWARKAFFDWLERGDLPLSSSSHAVPIHGEGGPRRGGRGQSRYTPSTPGTSKLLTLMAQNQEA